MKNEVRSLIFTNEEKRETLELVPFSASGRFSGEVYTLITSITNADFGYNISAVADKINMCDYIEKIKENGYKEDEENNKWYNKEEGELKDIEILSIRDNVKFSNSVKQYSYSIMTGKDGIAKLYKNNYTNTILKIEGNEALTKINGLNKENKLYRFQIYTTHPFFTELIFKNLKLNIFDVFYDLGLNIDLFGRDANGTQYLALAAPLQLLNQYRQYMMASYIKKNPEVDINNVDKPSSKNTLVINKEINTINLIGQDKKTTLFSISLGNKVTLSASEAKPDRKYEVSIDSSESVNEDVYHALIDIINLFKIDIDIVQIMQIAGEVRRVYPDNRIDVIIADNKNTPPTQVHKFTRNGAEEYSRTVYVDGSTKITKSESAL